MAKTNKSEMLDKLAQLAKERIKTMVPPGQRALLGEIADLAGLNPATLRNLLNRSKDNLKNDSIEKIFEAIGLNLEITVDYSFVVTPINEV